MSLIGIHVVNYANYVFFFIYPCKLPNIYWLSIIKVSFFTCFKKTKNCLLWSLTEDSFYVDLTN